MATHFHGDYSLPHTEQMACVALNTTGGKAHMGKPAPNTWREERKEG